MGRIIEISKGKYRLIADLGYKGGIRKRKVKTISARNKTEAAKQLNLFETELKNNESFYFGEYKDITFLSFFSMWKDKYADTAFAPRTRDEHISSIKSRVIPRFGNYKLTEISKMDVVHFFDDLQKNGRRLDKRSGPLSSSTLHNIYKAFNSVMSLAKEWDIIPMNPCKGVKLPTLKHKKGEAYSEEEIGKLVYLLENDTTEENSLIAKIALISGCRAGEIAALEAKHLKPENNTLFIEQSMSMDEKKLIVKSTKTDRTRSVSIPKPLMDELLRWKIKKQTQLLIAGSDRKWKEHNFLFSDEFGQPRRPDSISQFWNRFIERNDIRKIRFHDLRHTSATLLINKGVHAKVIQERLGHATIGTTMNVYGHVLEQADQTAATHFESLFNKKTNE